MAKSARTSSKKKDSSADRTVRILHLSDFHLSKKRKWDSDPVLRGLVIAVRDFVESGLAPDVVAITGDIANTGAAEEYAEAERWIQNGLLKSLPTRFPKSRILIVPGNHDVERGAVRDAAEGLQDRLLREASQDAIARVLDDEEGRSLLLKRHTNYLAFANRYRSVKQKLDVPWWSCVLEIRGVKLHFVGLCSSWMSHSEDDHGRLLVGTWQANPLFGQAEDVDARVVLIHHPWSFLAEFDAADLESLTHRHADLVLRGHLHQPQARAIHDPDDAHIELPAGAAYAGGKYPNSFQLVEFLADDDLLRVHYRLWKDGQWIPDRNAYQAAKDGVATLRLRDNKQQIAVDHPPTENAAPPSVPVEYTEWHLRRCSELELMGLELKHGSGVKLNQVYTPLATSFRPERDPGKESAKERSGRKKGRSPLELSDQEQEAKYPLLDMLDQRSLYVSGDPGSGKSTFCRWVTWLTCHGELPKIDEPAPDELAEHFPASLNGRLPLLVLLRDFWPCLPASGAKSIGVGGLEQALQCWLTNQSFPGLDWPLVKAHLDQGSVLLMLDGVDEVPSIRRDGDDAWYPRETLLDALSEAVARWTDDGNRVLVTSRPYGLSGPQQQRLKLPHAPILGLDEQLQTLLVRRWFVRLKEDRELGLETADTMLDHLRVERGVDHLAPNPLLLTAMCIIYDEGKRLPHDKYELYDRVVDTVLHKRYPVKERIDPVRGQLAAVALGMHTGDGLGVERANPEAAASDHEIDTLLQAYQQLDGSTDRGLTDTVRAREELLSNSGLLVSRGDDTAEFFHLSIQEFLAGERAFLLHFRDWKKLVDLMATRGQAAGWRNTVSFLFGCLVAKLSPHVGIECLHEIALRVDLPAGGPSKATDLAGTWNLAIVLGDCLQIVCGRGGAIPKTLQDKFQSCVFQAIEHEIPVKERQTLAVALGHLGDPRIAADLRITGHPDEHPGFVKVPAGKYFIGDEKKPLQIKQDFWLSKYPVTNSQFALFVDAKGYEQEDLWLPDGWKWRTAKDVKAPLYWRRPEFNGPNQPVVGVSWWEADAFCRWLGLRLPTADEAEAAARGPSGLVYPWGDEWEFRACNSEFKLGGTSAVGIFPRDRAPCGAWDVAGNVLEWCEEKAGATLRVIRGGSWDFGARGCRGAFRGGNGPGFRYGYLGFRVAAVPPRQAKSKQANRAKRSLERRPEGSPKEATVGAGEEGGA